MEPAVAAEITRTLKDLTRTLAHPRQILELHGRRCSGSNGSSTSTSPRSLIARLPHRYLMEVRP